MNIDSYTHELKIELPYYQAVVDGLKTFEIRKNDRNFKVGDFVILRAYSRENGCYYPAYPPVKREIKYLTDYAQQDGYVVFSI